MSESIWNSAVSAFPLAPRRLEGNISGMFRRRRKVSLLANIGQWIWPRMGWRRTTAYFWHRLQRIPGTPSSIAAGFACGAAVAMTPFYGTHILTGMLIAFAIRGNVIASVLGAQISNPWTAAPLWFAAYYLGAWMMGFDPVHHPPNFVQMFKALTESVLNTDMKMFSEKVWPIFWPMTLGSIPMALAAGLGSYFVLIPILKTVQARRLLRLQRKPERAQASTGADA
jgi:uncharacterized protein (DUF2062 family)